MAGYNMYPMYNPMSRMEPPPQPMAQPGYVSRPVTSREEALGVPVDYFGLGTLMPDLPHGLIYFKRFNPSTGSSDFLTFALQQESPEQPAYAAASDLQDIRMTIEQLKEDVEKLKRPSAKAVKSNEQ